jgi:hypothetical protein
MNEYAVTDGGVTIAGASTLVFINPAAAPNVNLEFYRCWVGQSQNATSAQQRVEIETQVTAFPTLTSTAPNRLKRASAVSVITGNTTGAAGTSGTDASAEGGGAKTSVWEDAFNVLNGWLWVPTPPETIIMPAGSSSGIGLFLPVAPANLDNWAFGMVFGER